MPAQMNERVKTELKKVVNDAVESIETVRVSIEQPELDGIGLFHYNVRIAYCDKNGMEIAIFQEEMNSVFNSIELPIKLVPKFF